MLDFLSDLRLLASSNFKVYSEISLNKLLSPVNYTRFHFSRII